MNRADAPAAEVQDGPDRQVEDGSEDDGDMAAQARFALETLAELDAGNGVSLPRLAKRTGLRVSVLLRLYTLMSDARVGDQQGPGWVRLHVDEDGRWIARITPAGRGDGEADTGNAARPPP
ncbi:hypothetical protein [Roseateles noduli]|uniref:hypothetical protein n=1 Tax=Roseateles noduli TaxID=2052484 RepID=UPI003D660A8A